MGFALLLVVPMSLLAVQAVLALAEGRAAARARALSPLRRRPRH